MKADSKVKRFLPFIIVSVFGLLLFLCVIGMEFNLHFRIYERTTLSKSDLLRIFSDAFFVPSVFITGTALLGIAKYVNLVAILYSAFQSLGQFISLGFIPKSSRKAYRQYRKASKEESGTGLAMMLLFGLVLLAVALTLMFIYKGL